MHNVHIFFYLFKFAYYWFPNQSCAFTELLLLVAKEGIVSAPENKNSKFHTLIIFVHTEVTSPVLVPSVPYLKVVQMGHLGPGQLMFCHVAPT